MSRRIERLGDGDWYWKASERRELEQFEAERARELAIKEAREAARIARAAEVKKNALLRIEASAYAVGTARLAVADKSIRKEVVEIADINLVDATDERVAYINIDCESMVDVNGGRYLMYVPTGVPMSLVEGLKSGESKSMMLPCRFESVIDDTVSGWVEFTLTAQDNGGLSFEEKLSKK